MTTVVTTTSSGPYAASGETTFPVTFQSLSATEIEVTLDGVTLDPGTYSFNRDADGTGSVSTNNPISGEVMILSAPNFQQLIQFERFGAFYPDQIDPALDRQARTTLTLRDRIDTLQTNDVLQDVNIEALQEIVNSQLTVTIADGASVSTRALLAAISSPVAGQSASLTEAGREGTFVFSTANLSAQVTADPLQGIYVPPSSDTTGASGAWVRKFSGAYRLEWFGGNADSGTTDNKVAWDALRTLTGGECEVYLDNNAGYYGFSQMTFSDGITVRMSTRQNVGIMITGDGGGAPSAGVNGGVRMFGNGCSIRNGRVSYNNPLLQCLINISSSTAAGRNIIEDLDVVPTGITAAQMVCTAVAVGNQTEFEWKGGQIGPAPGFKQNLLQVGFLNGCKFENVTFQTHALDIPNGVFHTANHLVSITLSSWALEFDNCTFEQGPNGVQVAGQGSVNFLGCYLGDAALAKMWLPNDTVAQGEIRFPSASITADATSGSTTLTNVSSTTPLFVGMRVKIVGAGAAGAVLSTRITQVTPTVTIATAPSTTALATSVYYGAYLGHGYIAKTAGTTGASIPVFPTTASGEVIDNTTTWREHGSCAWIDASTTGGFVGKNAITVDGGFISNSVCGVLARRVGGATPGAINVRGVAFLGPALVGQFDGVLSSTVTGCQLNAYQDRGFEYFGVAGGSFSNRAEGNHSTNNANPCDFVVSTTSANMAGSHQGSTVVTGVGAARWSNENSFLGALTTTFPGVVSVPSVNIGAGTPLTKAQVYTPTLTPASVAAATVAEQTFTVTGLTTADMVIVNPPAIANATGLAGVRVSAANTLAIRFFNPTAGALTPTSGIYTVLAIRS